MVIIFPPFHFPLLSSTPFLLHCNLLLQAIGLSYKCHSVHVCVVRVHPSSCIRGYGMFAMCQFADTEKENTLRCLMFYFGPFLDLKYLACTPKSFSDLKKEPENTAYQCVLILFPQRIQPHVIYTVCLQYFHVTHRTYMHSTYAQSCVHI